MTGRPNTPPLSSFDRLGSRSVGEQLELGQALLSSYDTALVVDHADQQATLALDVEVGDGRREPTSLSAEMNAGLISHVWIMPRTDS